MAIARPDPATVSPGRRELVFELYELYLLAGAPALAKIERLIADGYPRRASITLSRQGILNTLRGATWPRWESLESLIQAFLALADPAISDGKPYLDRFHRLWTAAIADGSNAAAASRPQSNPVVPEQRSEPLESSLSVLTRREREVARLVAQGFTNRQIAESLFVSESTVATHLHRIMTKLQLSSRTQLALFVTGVENNTEI